MGWIAPERIPLVASGAAMVLLAGALLAIDFQKRVNRAFAAILAVRGGGLVVAQVGADPRWQLLSAQVTPYFVLPVLPLAAYFASIYPRPRGPLGRPGGGWVTVAVAVALDGLYALWHTGYQTLAVGVGAMPILQARDLIVFTSIGPLMAVGLLAAPVFAALAVVFARDYTKSASGTQRTSYFLVAAGFLVNGLFDGARQLVGLASFLPHTAGFPWGPWGWALPLVPALSIIPAMIALLVITRHHFRERGQERRLESRLYWASGLALATALAPALLPGGAFFVRSPPLVLLLGIWRLTLPGLVSYALLRYALFDLDRKVRVGVAWSIVAAVFGFTFFLVSNLLQGVVQDRAGTLGGLAAAGALTLAARPIAGFGRKLATRLMPDVHEFSKKTKEAVAVYRDQFAMLQEDGTLSRKERLCLDRLRERLGLPEHVTANVERQLREEAPPPRPSGLAA